MKLVFVILFFVPLFSANISIAASENDTIRMKSENILYCPADRLDSLLLKWCFFSGRDSLSYFKYSDRENLLLDVPDSVFEYRIRNIMSPVQLTYNKLVQSYIDRYVKRGRWMAPKFLGLSIQYFPIFEEILDSYDLPLELKYLPAIESAFNPHAVSRAGATGIWQIMYRTGLFLGLEINSYVDERRDPVKSTEAACIYLKQLYDTYECWNLALAAYNCGPACVNNAIRRSGGKTNYWEILPYLPHETRNYIPAFTAISYLFQYYNEHNYKPEFIEFYDDYDTVMVSKQLHFAQIDSVLGVSVNELRELNPQYRKDIIPAKEKAYPLRLRRQNIGEFIRLEDSIYSFRDSIFFNPGRFNYKPDEKIADYVRFVPQPEGTVELTYIVKSGDVIGHIARWYGVNVNDLKGWNGISRNLIRVGQKLKVYVPEAVAAHYKSVDKMSFEEKQRMVGIETTPKKETVAINTGEFEWYTVKRGDNPWEISKKFSGVTVDEILKINGLTGTSKLNIGDKLKIPKKN